ncbi:CAP domain-containing protein [Cellulophaga tyrosinoxydans]|uniref:Uncharacterized conserved protein YkwD, contains CAP (CSP/antigen 5/PR1) domain n=1 Tax=Cellulophaga tyrosinoxydans TaxID=504486 RepID=A0A1W1Z261_9FLAO|nr:CAP domain-containing protein [Cellulophaga tyrosinoxydans]SMC42519.1 Uncharacterized conserved protein YkwD, contains CAP (CSP/antigen 5/PR1) domain [Cellulophaga tyrosinoxydans]
MIFLISLQYWFTRANRTLEIPFSTTYYLQIEQYMKMKMPYALMFLFVLIVSSCSKETIENTILVESENAIIVENEILETVNSYRTANGYNSLAYSAVAYKYANAHTDYMIAKGSISHDNFSARASDISSEVNASQVSENVARNYASAQETFENWMNSSDHRKSIEGDFTHTAVSVKLDANGNYYYTQLFYKLGIQ